MRRIPPVSPWWTVIVTTVSLTCSLLVFYGVPIVPEAEDAPGLVQVVFFGLGLSALAAILAVQLRRQIRASSDLTVRVGSIFSVLSPLVVFFALTYYLLEMGDPGEFAGLVSRTDALYYTVVTLGTVGYGDIHATGDAAKVVTMVQIIVDLVVVGALVTVVTRRVRGRAEIRAAEHGPRQEGTPDR